MTSTATSDVRAPAGGAQAVHAGITPARGRGLVAAYVGITALVLALLMVFGLLMKASQAGVITIPPARFYQLLTAHGIGMVAISGLGGAGVMWYFLSRYVELSPAILLANLVFFLAGVVLVLGGIFLGGFAAAWTFLFPLPAHSQGVWGMGATASYLIGVLLVGVGFLQRTDGFYSARAPPEGLRRAPSRRRLHRLRVAHRRRSASERVRTDDEPEQAHRDAGRIQLYWRRLHGWMKEAASAR